MRFSFVMMPEMAIYRLFCKPNEGSVIRRPIFVDILNTARTGSQARKQNCYAAVYHLISNLVQKGHAVFGFVPQAYFNSYEINTHPELIQYLRELGVVIATPSRGYIQEKTVNNYDDLFALMQAASNGGALISNDRFLDIFANHKQVVNDEQLEKFKTVPMRCVKFDRNAFTTDKWISENDEVMYYTLFPKDGCKGITDAEFFTVSPDDPDYQLASKFQFSQNGQQIMLNYLRKGFEDYPKDLLFLPCRHSMWYENPPAVTVDPNDITKKHATLVAWEKNRNLIVRLIEAGRDVHQEMKQKRLFAKRYNAGCNGHSSLFALDEAETHVFMPVRIHSANVLFDTTTDQPTSSGIRYNSTLKNFDYYNDYKYSREMTQRHHSSTNDWRNNFAVQNNHQRFGLPRECHSANDITLQYRQSSNDLPSSAHSRSNYNSSISNYHNSRPSDEDSEDSTCFFV